MSQPEGTAAPRDPSAAGPLAGEQARQLLERARELSGQGDFAAAGALYGRVLGHPEPIVHVAALLGLADVRYRLDDEEGALQAWIMATQAPETPITWQAWVALAGARVRQNDLPGATRAYREAERRAPAHEQSAIASRLGWLNKELGRQGTAERYFGRARAGGAFVPLATWAILALTVGIGASSLLNPAGGDVWVELLGLDKQALARGELWRLVTVALVHGNLVHLAFNMYALYMIGPIVELLYGRVLFVAFYVLSAALGSVASYLVLPNPSVGASGAVFGLFGLLLVSLWIHKPPLARQARGLAGQIAILIAFNLAIGFGLGGGLMGGRIDNAAHVGGLIAGSWLGLAVIPRGVAAMRSVRGPSAVLRATAAPRGQGWPLRLAAMMVVVAVIAVGIALEPVWA